MKREHFPARTVDDVELPFSEAVRAGSTYYLAGRIGLNPKTSQPPEDPGDEARLLMDGLRRALNRWGLSTRHIVQVTVHTPDVSLFDVFNEVYVTYFDGPLPARAFVGSGPLLFGARFELTAVAVAD